MRHRETRVYPALAWYESGHMLGIDRYACEANWTVDRSLVNLADDLRRFQPHGIISQLIRRVHFVEDVEAARVPVVELATAIPEMHVPRVIPDAVAEGALAAAHLIERGFTRFIFIGGSYDAVCRQAFIRAVRAAGTDPLVVTTDDPNLQRETGEANSQTQLVHDERSALRRAWARRFFSKCDKPVGVYVLSKAWAASIIEGCREARILVPEQVAVLSKADLSDEGKAWPVPLTVLAPDYEEQAYQAARLLDRMIKGEKVSPTAWRRRNGGASVTGTGRKQSGSDCHVAILPAPVARPWQQEAPATGHSTGQPESRPESLDVRVLRLLDKNPLGKKSFSLCLGHKKISGRLNKTIRQLLADKFIEYTVPDKPNSRLQQYRLTEKGRRKIKVPQLKL